MVMNKDWKMGAMVIAMRATMMIRMITMTIMQQGMKRATQMGMKMDITRENPNMMKNRKKTTNQIYNDMIKFLLLTSMLFLGTPGQDVFAQQKPKQCQATTQKGTRCKREAEPNSKFCDVHQAKDSKVKQCKAKTKEDN